MFLTGIQRYTSMFDFVIEIVAYTSLFPQGRTISNNRYFCFFTTHFMLGIDYL